MKKTLPIGEFCLDFSFNGCEIDTAKHNESFPHKKQFNLEHLLRRGKPQDYETAKLILNVLRDHDSDNSSHYQTCTNKQKSKIDQYEAMLLTNTAQNIQDLKKAQALFETSARLDIGNPMARYEYAQLLQHELDNTGPFAVININKKNGPKKRANKNDNKTKLKNGRGVKKENIISDTRKKEIVTKLNDNYRLAIRYPLKLTLEQQSSLNLDYAKHLYATEKHKDALERFQKVDWNDSNYTTREEFNDLKHYIKALFKRNMFQKCFQMVENVDRCVLKQDDKNFVVRILGVSKKFVEANNKIGDLFDCKKSGKLDKKYNKFFKYWLENEKINILSLLRFMKLFGVDEKLLP